MIRGRTSATGGVEVYDDATGNVVFTIDSTTTFAPLIAAIATTTDPEDGATIWNDDGTLKEAASTA